MCNIKKTACLLIATAFISQSCVMPVSFASGASDEDKYIDDFNMNQISNNASAWYIKNVYNDAAMQAGQASIDLMNDMEKKQDAPQQEQVNQNELKMKKSNDGAVVVRENVLGETGEVVLDPESIKALLSDEQRKNLSKVTAVFVNGTVAQISVYRTDVLWPGTNCNYKCNYVETFDALGRLVKQVWSTKRDYLAREYEYYDTGSLKKMMNYQSKNPNADGFYEEWTWDSTGELNRYYYRLNQWGVTVNENYAWGFGKPSGPYQVISYKGLMKIYSPKMGLNKFNYNGIIASDKFYKDNDANKNKQYEINGMDILSKDPKAEERRNADSFRYNGPNGRANMISLRNISVLLSPKQFINENTGVEAATDILNFLKGRSAESLNAKAQNSAAGASSGDNENDMSILKETPEQVADILLEKKATQIIEELATRQEKTRLEEDILNVLQDTDDFRELMNKKTAETYQSAAILMAELYKVKDILGQTRMMRIVESYLKFSRQWDTVDGVYDAGYKDLEGILEIKADYDDPLVFGDAFVKLPVSRKRKIVVDNEIEKIKAMGEAAREKRHNDALSAWQGLQGTCKSMLGQGSELDLSARSFVEESDRAMEEAGAGVVEKDSLGWRGYMRMDKRD